MKSTLVTILKNNTIMDNVFFKNIEDGEKRFSEECLKLDKALELEDLPGILDDGYFTLGEITVCINSFISLIEPTHGVMFVANNCIDYVKVHHNRYEIKNVFQDILFTHSSNGDDYTSDDIEQLMDIGQEKINTSKVYYFKLEN